MPIYEYRCVEDDAGCAYCQQGFDVLARSSDPEPEHCPRCGCPVRQRISAPAVVTGQAHLLKESHIEKHGFTQYRKVGGGVYEKTAGKGPQYISGDQEP